MIKNSTLSRAPLTSFLFSDGDDGHFNISIIGRAENNASAPALNGSDNGAMDTDAGGGGATSGDDLPPAAAGKKKVIHARPVGFLSNLKVCTK